MAMHIVFEQYRRSLLQRSCWCIKFGVFVALWAVYITGVSANAQQPCPPVLITADGEPTVNADNACKVQSETPDYADPVANVTLLDGRVTTNAANSASLDTELADQDCGETIQLSDATYTGNRTISASCPANNPFIVKGAANFGSVATGTWTITGSRAIVTGIDFNGAKAVVKGVNSKFIGNRVRNWTSGNAILVGDSETGITQVEIAYNTIGPFNGSATTTHFGLKSNANSNSATVPTDIWVHHNDFNGNRDGSGNDTDFMEPGNSSHSYSLTFMARWYIEDNLFRDYADCNQNAIDMKFGGTVIRRNTIDNDCTVKLSSRIGASNIFESNYLDGGMILTHGRGHKVVCNSGLIRVQAGEADWHSVGKNANDVVPHNRSFEVLVARNTGQLIVGYQPNADYSLAAEDTTIEDHTGSISFAHHTGTVDHRNEGSSYACAPAIRLDAGDVGPAAMSRATSAYRAARGL